MHRKLVQSASRAALLFFLGLLASFAAAQSRVPKWSLHEISLTAGREYSNPYTDPDASVTATFTGPEGVARTVAGFWDGGNSFKVRFTPTAEGIWSYRTTSADGGLNGKHGKIACVVPPAGKHGFLRVDARHPYHFVWDDGTRYFMWGQTYYDWLLSALVNDNWKTSVDKALEHGMNKIRMHVYAQSFYTANVEFTNYPDAQPYLGSPMSPDRDRLNIPYWRKLDEMVQYMDSRGMVADLIITNPYSDNRMFGTAVQNDRFVNYVVSRYAAYPNVIWCVANEWNTSATLYKGTYRQSKVDFDRFGALVGSNDPWRAQGAALRPLTIHNTANSIGFQFYDSSWPTYVANQFHFGPGMGFIWQGDEWGNLGIALNIDLARNLGRQMPIANDEYAYIGQVYKNRSGQSLKFTRELVRNTIWGIATAGGYGSSGDIRLHPNGKGNPEITGDWQDAPEYGDLRRMVDFFTTKGIEYWKMSSRNETVTSGRRIYVLAEPGRQYVVYAAVGGSFSVSLTPASYDARRYDPRTGEEDSLGAVAGGGSRTFTMPDADDWVVYLSPNHREKER